MTVPLFESMIAVSVSTSAVIFLLFLMRRVLEKRFSAKWVCFLWLVLAARLLIPLSFPMILPTFRAEFIEDPSLSATFSPTGNSAPALDGKALPKTGSSIQNGKGAKTFPSKDGRRILASFWLAGAALLLAGHSVGYLLFWRKAGKLSRPEGNPDLLALFRSVRSEEGVKSGVKIWRSDSVSGPMITGLFRPVLFLPDRKFRKEEMEPILRHELIHWKRGDLWFHFLLLLDCSVHWFNPLVWMMSHRAKEEMELACDSEVVRNKDCEYRKSYGEILLSAAGAGRQEGLSFSGLSAGAKTMRRRFRNLFTPRKRRRGTAALFLAVLIVCIIGMMVSCGKPAQSTAAASSSVSAGPEDSETNAAEKVAGQWAEAVKCGDGKAQYQLLSVRCRKENDEKYQENHWSTGVSSPWVESYRVSSAGGGSAEVIYQYATSEGSAGSYRQTLKFVEEDKTLRIDSFSTLESVEDSTGLTAGSGQTKIIAYLSKYNPDQTVTADPVEWITDSDKKRIKELHLPEDDMPDGFYIYNPTKEKNVIRIALNAKISIFKDTGNTPVQTDLAGLSDRISASPGSLFWLIIQKGMATSVEEQYLP
jgi:beta-lactamase regulating signal transducer with metallopeptidase domain